MSARFTLIAAMGVYWAGFFKVILHLQPAITGMGFELNKQQQKRRRQRMVRPLFSEGPKGYKSGTCQGLPLQG